MANGGGVGPGCEGIRSLMATLQMTWQPSLLNQKRKSGPPLGLKNLGNTCYLNSVLQCLTYTPALANFCLKYQHSSSCDLVGYTTERKDCPFCILEKRIARSLNLELPLDSPLKINSSLKIFAEHFRHGRQEDAHEFLRYVIDACHNTCLRLRKLQLQRRKGGKGGENVSDETVVKEIFGGALQNQVKCLSCGTESNKVDEIMDISLDILHSSSLEDALNRFFQPETLDGNNKYQCDVCKKLVAARKQMSILQAPNVLVIQLKRFEGIFGGKIDKSIAFEELLVLSSYMCKATQDPHPEYRLFGTIIHSGFSPESGHYYAYIKDAVGRWYCCNDSHVSLSSPQEVVSEKAYILFFTRSKQRPSPSKNGLLANGSSCCVSNGSDASKIPRSCQSVRVESPVSNGHAGTDKSKSAIGKVPSSPSRNVDTLDSEGRKLSTNGGIKFAIHKKVSSEKTRTPMKSGDEEKERKSVATLTERNGITKSTDAKVFGCETGKASTLANGNGNIHKISDGLGDGGLSEGSIITNSTSLTGRKLIRKKLPNGVVKCDSDNSGRKRKLDVHESGGLLAKDHQSLVGVEAFKKVLEEEASQVLRTCGWSTEVFKFMHAQKKLCLEQAKNNASNILKMKSLLIAEARASFIAKVPESLKGSLVQRLMHFSQQKEAAST